MPSDPAAQLIRDVFDAVKAGRPASTSALRKTARFVNRNKRNVTVMVAAGVATALVTAATGGVALIGVAAYVGAKGGTFLAMRTWRAAKSHYYMKPVKEIIGEIREKNDESLAVERVDGDLVARTGVTPLLNRIRNEVHHSNMSAVMNDFQDFDGAKRDFDRLWEPANRDGIGSCAEAIKLVELLGKMARQYNRIAVDFDLICELTTFLILHKSRMDEEFRQRIDPVMDHLSGCYGRGSKAKYDNALLDLLNEAANSRDVLRHWNQRGGQDHRGWVGAVMGVEGKEDILIKYLEKAEPGGEEGPYGRTSRDASTEGGVFGVGVAITGATGGAKALSNYWNLVKFDPSAIGPGMAVGGGEALLGMGAQIANAEWNRYMLKRGKTLTFSGWRDLTATELVQLYRGEAKKEIEAMVDKFTHLIDAHDKWYQDAASVSTYSKGFDTLLIPATLLMRRQKLYWQIFHASSGLFANFAQFYEKVAEPVIRAEYSYLRDSDDRDTVHYKLEGKLREWLASHGDYDPCEGPCYMTTGQLATQLGITVPPITQDDPIRPLGARTVPFKPS